MHLILNSGTGRLATVAISPAPDGGFHRGSDCKSVGSQTKPAYIPHDMLRQEIRMDLKIKSLHTKLVASSKQHETL